MLSCVETVKSINIERNILELPSTATHGNQIRDVQLYLQISPFASWEHLAGRLFKYSLTTELEKVKKRMKPVRGQYNYVLYTIQPCRGSYT